MVRSWGGSGIHVSRSVGSRVASLYHRRGAGRAIRSCTYVRFAGTKCSEAIG